MKVMYDQKGKHCEEAEYQTYTHKLCTACGTVKAVSLFRRRKTKTRRGWAWDSHCIECRRAQCRDYGVRSREKRNARLRSWRKDNPRAAAKLDKRRHLKTKYGMTEQQVEQMRVAQGGKCAICGGETSRLFVDHCHIRGHVRGLLCQTCNTFLGWYEKKADTILRFQAYLADRTVPASSGVTRAMGRRPSDPCHGDALITFLASSSTRESETHP